MIISTQQAVEHLSALDPHLADKVKSALRTLFDDALDSGATIELLGSETAVSLRWLVAGAWTSLLLVYTGKWECIEINGPRSGRGARVTSAAERALSRALPLYGGTPGQRPSFELTALALPDSQQALREAFEAIAAAAFDSGLGDETRLPSRPWTTTELTLLRGSVNADLIAVLDRLAELAPKRCSMAELGADVGRSGRSVAALLGSFSGTVRSRFERSNWPLHVEQTPAGWDYWMESDEAEAWRASWVPGQPPSRRSGRGQLAELIERGLIQPGDGLTHVQVRQGITQTAEILPDGQLRTRLGDYAAPSTALADLVGFSINGWRYWRHDRTNETLAELRQRL